MQSQQAEDTGALQLYLFGVEAGQLHDVAERLDVTSQVSLCGGQPPQLCSSARSAVHRVYATVELCGPLHEVRHNRSMWHRRWRRRSGCRAQTRCSLFARKSARCLPCGTRTFACSPTHLSLRQTLNLDAARIVALAFVVLDCSRLASLLAARVA